MDVLLEAAGPQFLDLHEGSPLANLRSPIHIAARFIGGPDAHMLAGIVADAQHDELADAFRRRYLSERRKLIIGLMTDAIKAGELSAKNTRCGWQTGSSGRCTTGCYWGMRRSPTSLPMSCSIWKIRTSGPESRRTR